MLPSNKLIVCAAIRHKITNEIIIGVRHFDKFMHTAMDNMSTPDDCDEIWDNTTVEQGFITNEYDVDTNNYKFVTREEALVIALAAGQRLYRCGNDQHKLYSENLY